jgi:23S rRNA (uracil1939-C5)-methyltransferase
VPGDHVEVYLKRKRRGRFEGEADSLLQSRYKRQEPPCPHFGTCGGCRWQDLDYSD